MSAGLAEDGGDRDGLVDQLVDQRLVDREEEVLLLAHVVVQARLADADRVGDVGHRGGVVAALAEDPRRRFDDVGDGRRWHAPPWSSRPSRVAVRVAAIDLRFPAGPAAIRVPVHSIENDGPDPTTERL